MGTPFPGGTPPATDTPAAAPEPSPQISVARSPGRPDRTWDDSEEMDLSYATAVGSPLPPASTPSRKRSPAPSPHARSAAKRKTPEGPLGRATRTRHPTQPLLYEERGGPVQRTPARPPTSRRSRSTGAVRTKSNPLSRAPATDGPNHKKKNKKPNSANGNDNLDRMNEDGEADDLDPIDEFDPNGPTDDLD